MIVSERYRRHLSIATARAAAIRPVAWRPYLVGLWLGLLAATALAASPGALEQLRASNQCPGCDLRKADLRRQTLVGADLRGADLRQARLQGADLRGARLEKADLRGVALHEVVLAGADLRNADLRHLHVDEDLEFIDLRGVRLEGARFAKGVRCGPLPAKGGFGCSAQH